MCVDYKTGAGTYYTAPVTTGEHRASPANSVPPITVTKSAVRAPGAHAERDRAQPTRAEAGFTLVELVVAMASAIVVMSR